MANTKECVKEYDKILKEPNPLFVVRPDAGNILHFHFLIHGPPDSPYHGGAYHGVVKFPPEYPYKPPGIMMYTPSGRFKPASRLCFSMSDFHPESWNPMWSLSDENNYGSMTSTTQEKQQLAKYSHEYNRKDPIYRKHFADLLAAPNAAAATATTASTSPTTSQPATPELASKASPKAAAKALPTDRTSLWSILAVLLLLLLAAFINRAIS